MKQTDAADFFSLTSRQQIDYVWQLEEKLAASEQALADFASIVENDRKIRVSQIKEWLRKYGIDYDCGWRDAIDHLFESLKGKIQSLDSVAKDIVVIELQNKLERAEALADSKPELSDYLAMKDAKEQAEAQAADYKKALDIACSTNCGMDAAMIGAKMQTVGTSILARMRIAEKALQEIADNRLEIDFGNIPYIVDSKGVYAAPSKIIDIARSALDEVEKLKQEVTSGDD
jgi:hypothetical protein